MSVLEEKKWLDSLFIITLSFARITLEGSVAAKWIGLSVLTTKASGTRHETKPNCVSLSNAPPP